MGILGGIRRFFFQKTSNDFDANEAFRRNQQRYNALYALDPDVLVRHLSAFERGDICGLERVLDEFELREDKMRIGSFKMAPPCRRSGGRSGSARARRRTRARRFTRST